MSIHIYTDRIEIDGNEQIVINHTDFDYEMFINGIKKDVFEIGLYDGPVNFKIVLSNDTYFSQIIHESLYKGSYHKDLERNEILQWFKDHDYYVNKIVIGEWEKTDERWLSYLEERSVKRQRLDELESEE